MKKKFIIYLSLWAFLTFGLAACASMSTTIKPWSERSAKEKALAILSMYNAQFLNTLEMANNPKITDDQKEIVRIKKRILKELNPLIEFYLFAISMGQIPDKELENKILNLLDQLGGKLST